MLIYYNNPIAILSDITISMMMNMYLRCFPSIEPEILAPILESGMLTEDSTIKFSILTYPMEKGGSPEMLRP